MKRRDFMKITGVVVTAPSALLGAKSQYQGGIVKHPEEHLPLASIKPIKNNNDNIENKSTFSYDHNCILSGKTIGRIGFIKVFSVTRDYDSFEGQDFWVVNIPRKTRTIDLELEMTLKEIQRLRRFFTKKTKENWIVDFRDSIYCEFSGFLSSFNYELSLNKHLNAEIKLKIMSECRYWRK